MLLHPGSYHNVFWSYAIDTAVLVSSLPHVPGLCCNSHRLKTTTSRVSAHSPLLFVQPCQRCSLEVSKMSSRAKQRCSKSSVSCPCYSRISGPITASLLPIICLTSLTWTTGFINVCLPTFTCEPVWNLLLQQRQETSRSRRGGSSSISRRCLQRRTTTAAQPSPVVVVTSRIPLATAVSSES